MYYFLKNAVYFNYICSYIGLHLLNSYFFDFMQLDLFKKILNIKKNC